MGKGFPPVVKTFFRSVIWPARNGSFKIQDTFPDAWKTENETTDVTDRHGCENFFIRLNQETVVYPSLLIRHYLAPAKPFVKISAFGNIALPRALLLTPRKTRAAVCWLATKGRRGGNRCTSSQKTVKSSSFTMTRLPRPAASDRNSAPRLFRTENIEVGRGKGPNGPGRMIPSLDEVLGDPLGWKTAFYRNQMRSGMPAGIRARPEASGKKLSRSSRLFRAEKRMKLLKGRASGVRFAGSRN